MSSIIPARTLIWIGMLSILLLSINCLADSAPSFKLPTGNGELSLEEHKGKVIYLDFWASWCSPCRKSFPWMNELQKRYGDQGFTVIAVNLDKKSELAAQFLTEHPAIFPVAYDAKGESAEQYKVQAMPSSYLIDRDLTIHTRHLGFRDQDKAKIESAIEQLLAKPH